ncbi:DUF938 domain-containing protein [Halomonas sp. HP20-15]|uniref:DUF938 domain-containing protein n=1 Tax=Halomonas sp. HP20-15 TaxID=3085901 RepID=UPI0029814749|nr:DUF938 domain-containing protein [Halomonas sp. HP20-15]MDW5377487.1 DUF938 domain-containing protein [Halomonas sp. HP20-15]
MHSDDKTSDARLSSAAVARNREPILEVLKTALDGSSRVLEIASGSGEHAVHFAAALPNVHWQPSDPEPRARASIAAWRDVAALDNLAGPIELNVLERPWSERDFDALVVINMLHISPWEASEALLGEAGARLPEGGVLFLYGPFQRDGVPTAPSNIAFDADLRRRDPSWGIRSLAAIRTLARANGLSIERIVEMPANNLSVVLRRRAA